MERQIVKIMIFASLTLLVLPVTSCDRGGESGGVSFEDFPEAMAHAVCTNVMRCCTPEELQEIGYRVSNMEECLEQALEWNEFLFSMVEEAYELDEVSFDRNAAADFTDRVEQAACAVDPDDQLESLFEPRQEEGMQCHSPISCIDSRCDGHVGMAEFGICKVPAEEGGQCRNNDQCADGLYCECPEEDPECSLVDGECQPSKGPAQACQENSECQSPLHCSPGGVCAEPLDEGEVCQDTTECQPDMFCSRDGFCSRPSSEGDTCANGERCQSSLLCFESSLTCEVPCTEIVTYLGCSSAGRTAGAFMLVLLVPLAFLRRRRRYPRPRSRGPIEA